MNISFSQSLTPCNVSVSYRAASKAVSASMLETEAKAQFLLLLGTLLLL